MPTEVAAAPTLPRWLVYFLIFGLFLTLRGYHSRDGDQAYRLPLLLHRQNPAQFADDPFVRAFDAFNPHRGYLTLLDVASRPLGLSAGLAALFALTFALTCAGLDRMARAVWPEAGPKVGVVAVVLVLAAKAGNIGTNHLFEAMLLDRLIGFALGWLAFSRAVSDPERGRWTAAACVGLASLVHPSVGLQIGMLLGAAWVGWALWPAATDVRWRQAVGGVVALVVALAPGAAMNLGQGAKLFEGLPLEEFRLLSVDLQGPQHMLPHLWRFPQWLAWGCYPVLAVLALRRPRPATDAPAGSAARFRLGVLVTMNLAALASAWVAVELLHDLRVTLFQPFRMATILRGLALVALSGRILGLWRQGGLVGRARATLLVVGSAGDWAFVVATFHDVSVEIAETLSGPHAGSEDGGGGTRAPNRQGRPDPLGLLPSIAVAAVLAGGIAFMARHDTESGHVPMLVTLGFLGFATLLLKDRTFVWNGRRIGWAIAGAWGVPLAALIVAGTPARTKAWARPLLERCRFAAVPTDDVERLAVWCRDHTPASARFIGPPGPKTFRLWSRRSLAFNRAGSPYHARGLAGWAEQFREHVAFKGSLSALVHAYLSDRHGLERRYQAMTDSERAGLAVRQGASYVVAAPPASPSAATQGPLELLHVEGRYAVYRLRSALETAHSELPPTHR